MTQHLFKKFIFFLLLLLGFNLPVQAQKASLINRSLNPAITNIKTVTNQLDDKEDYESGVCTAAEPQGMNTFKKCSKDCKTVCSFKKRIGEVNCFACQQGGDDTCADIGAFEADHDWCKPGGVCHSDPMLYCTPFGAIGPRRSKLQCTNCKQRPDMCWQKVQDGTTTFTNCKLGCWDGTCEYRGRYDELEWDMTTEWIHCYECVTPPPPPTCEDMKWGWDWESDCLNNCADPGICKEILMTMKDKPAADDKKDGEDAEGEKGGDAKGGKKLNKTRTKKDQDEADGKVPRANPPTGGGSSGTGNGAGSSSSDKSKPKPVDPCKEVADTLRNPGIIEEPHPDFISNQKKAMERFKQSVSKLHARAQEVEKHLKGRRDQLANVESRLREAESALKKAKSAARGAENLGGYGKIKLRELKTAKINASRLRAEYGPMSSALKRDTASFGRDIAKLKRQAQKDLYRADPKAKHAESLDRVDQYYEANRDLSHLNQRRTMSDRIFAEKSRELQRKIDKGGSQADDYQRQLDNLNRGKKDYDKSLNSRERNLKQHINHLQKQNGEDGVGPFDKHGLLDGVGEAGMQLNKEYNKIKKLRDTLAKAAKNNCPPKGSEKAIAELDKRLKDIQSLMDTFENRYDEIDKGYPLSEEDKKSIEFNIRRVADGSKKFDGEKSMASFYLESQAEEIARTFDPTDPRVGLKKAFWYTVGVVEGVGKAIKGLVDLGVGTLDLIGETAAKYAGYEDGGIFGTDASAVLQKVLGGADGNLNLDGLEKLAKGMDKAISAYFKKLSRSTDYDKTLSRAGGQFAGEFVVGDKVLGGVIKGASKLYGATKARKTLKGLKTGTGASKAPPPPRIPDINGPPKTPDAPPGTSSGRRGAGAADNVPQGPKVTPKEPRGPPKVAKELDNTKPLERGNRQAKPLDEATAKDLETQNGFRRDHADNMHQFAQEHDAFVIVRDGNPDSVKFMDNPDMMPKPVTSKAKTAKVGPETNKGLVVDPTHPTQAKYWDDAIADAANAGDAEKLAWLKKHRRKAITEWNKYGKKMQKQGYFVQDNGVIGYTDPKTGKVYKGIHGDYDLHGVYKATPDGSRATGRVSYGEGTTIKDGEALRNQFNRKIDPKKDYIQHGAQDDWVPDPKMVPNKPPDPPATIFFPDGRPPKRLETAADMKKFYETEMGIKFDYPDPPKATSTSTPKPTGSATPKGLESGTGAPRAPPPKGLNPQPPTKPRDFNANAPTNVGGSIQPPKVSTHATSNSDLNFIATGGQQVELKTGKQLGAGSTSIVYVDATNPKQVIRVTDMAGDVKEAVRLDKKGRGIIDNISETTDSVRMSKEYKNYTVQNMPRSHLNNSVVTVGENMQQGMAKGMIAKQGGQLTEKQAKAINRATQDLNNRGYAWLDNKPDNYTFEKIPGTDDLRVVIVDPGGVVPMKGLDPKKARAIQRRVNQPTNEFVENMNMTNNAILKDSFAAEEWQKIIATHGDDIDIKALGIADVKEVKFNPSGNVNQSRIGELFGN